MNWAEHENRYRRANRTQQKAWREAVLTRDNHTCQINGPTCTITATEADHIIPLSERGTELHIENGQAVCHTCHQQKTQSEAARARAAWKRKPEPHPAIIR